MGKGTIVGIIILVPAVLCSAAAYVTGMQIEEGWQTSLMESGVRDNIKDAHYRRGIFSSRAGGCIDLNHGGDEPPLDVCYVVDITHGPLVLNGATLLPRLATFEAQLDTSGAGMGAQMVRGLFSDPQPVLAQAQIFFNGRMEFSVDIKPFELDSPFFQVSGGNLNLRGWTDQGDIGSASQFTGRDLYVGVMDEFQLSMPSISSSWQQTGVSDNGRPMGQHRFSAPMVFLGLGEKLGNYAGSMDVLAALDTRVADDLADSSAGLWLDNVALDGSTVTGLYLGYDASGLNMDAALRMQELLTRHDQLSRHDDPQVVADELLAWTEDFQDAISNLLDGTGQIQTKLVVEDENGALMGITSSAQPRRGSAGSSASSPENPLAVLGGVFDMDTKLYLAPAALYGADRDMIQVLVDNGVLRQQRDASYALRLQMRDGMQWLNGEFVVPERLAQVINTVGQLMLPQQEQPVEPSP